MTQRSQFNDRYKEDSEHKGVTRKGATSLKPKTKAAASVYIEPEKKTPQQRKAARKAREKEEREKEDKLARVYADRERKATSPKLKQYRTWWWICLVLAIAFTLVSWLGRSYLPEWATVVTLVLAYAAIIAALYLDLGKIRKERKRIVAAREQEKTKANKAERKARKAEERAALKEAEAQIKAEEEEKARKAEERKAKGGLFGLSKAKAVAAADEVVEKQQAAKEANEQ